MKSKNFDKRLMLGTILNSYEKIDKIEVFIEIPSSVK